MIINRQRTLSYVDDEWGTYIERFNRLPVDEQETRVKMLGYESFRDLLAHILAWWDEGMGVIHALAERREFERKKYDFDVFNAEAVDKYRVWDEAEFLSRFEETRKKMGADLRSMDEALFENPRVKSWIRGILISHAREHLVALSRFLVIDILENEWRTYIEDFHRLEPEKQTEFLSRGFEIFHDLLAHMWLGGEGARLIIVLFNNLVYGRVTTRMYPGN